jgi:hypothetical protein
MQAENKAWSSLYKLSSEDDNFLFSPVDGYIPEKEFKEMSQSLSDSMQELKKKTENFFTVM